MKVKVSELFPNLEFVGDRSFMNSLVNNDDLQPGGFADQYLDISPERLKELENINEQGRVAGANLQKVFGSNGTS